MHREESFVGFWMEDGFEIRDVKIEKIGSAALADFTIVAPAPIVRAWADGAIFYESPKVVSSCYGAIWSGNELHVSKLTLAAGYMPKITIEC
jgi:hypothetical protein